MLAGTVSNSSACSAARVPGRETIATTAVNFSTARNTGASASLPTNLALVTVKGLSGCDVGGEEGLEVQTLEGGVGGSVELGRGAEESECALVGVEL